LLLKRPIALDCPVRLLQGMEDPDVPWRWAIRIAEQLTARDVAVTLIKDGDHRLSRPQDLARLAATLDALSEQIAAKAF
jgi:alpha-beta hydrolase superfamily lysophospholipase